MLSTWCVLAPPCIYKMAKVISGHTLTRGQWVNAALFTLSNQSTPSKGSTKLRAAVLTAVVFIYSWVTYYIWDQFKGCRLPSVGVGVGGWWGSFLHCVCTEVIDSPIYYSPFGGFRLSQHFLINVTVPEFHGLIEFQTKQWPRTWKWKKSRRKTALVSTLLMRCHPSVWKTQQSNLFFLRNSDDV